MAMPSYDLLAQLGAGTDGVAYRGVRGVAGVALGSAVSLVSYPSVRQVLGLLTLARPGERWLSQAVMDDPSVSALLRESGLEGQVTQFELAGLPQTILHRFVVPEE